MHESFLRGNKVCGRNPKRIHSQNSLYSAVRLAVWSLITFGVFIKSMNLPIKRTSLESFAACGYHVTDCSLAQIAIDTNPA